MEKEREREIEVTRQTLFKLRLVVANGDTFLKLVISEPPSSVERSPEFRRFEEATEDGN